MNMMGVILGVLVFGAAILFAYVAYKFMEHKDKKKQAKLTGLSVQPTQPIYQPQMSQQGYIPNVQGSIDPKQIELFEVQKQLREIEQYKTDLLVREKALKQLVNIRYGGR